MSSDSNLYKLKWTEKNQVDGLMILKKASDHNFNRIFIRITLDFDKAKEKEAVAEMYQSQIT
jgi:hypothetical protein